MQLNDMLVLKLEINTKRSVVRQQWGDVDEEKGLSIMKPDFNK